MIDRPTDATLLADAVGSAADAVARSSLGNAAVNLAGMLYGYGVDCHCPTNHLKRLAGTRAAISANDGRWSSRRRLEPSRRM